MNEIGSCLFLPYRKDGLIRLSHFTLRIQSSAEKHVSYINDYVRKKEWMHNASEVLFEL